MSKENCGHISTLLKQIEKPELTQSGSGFRYHIIPPQEPRGLRYIYYEPFPNKYVWGTLKEFKDSDEAWHQFSLLKKHKSKYVLHANQYLNDGDNHYLIFPGIVFNFEHWLNDCKWSDKEVYNIFRKIGRYFQYLFDKGKNCHGDLHGGGICITKDNEAYLWELVEGDHQHGGSFRQKIEALKTIVKRIIELRGKCGKQSNSVELKELTGYLDFLEQLSSEYSDSNLCKKLSNWPQVLYEFALNYPIFWEEKQNMQFIANLHLIDSQCDNNFFRREYFSKPLKEKLQKIWLVERFTDPVLDLMIQFKNPNKLKKLISPEYLANTYSSDVPAYGSYELASFVYNCLKHYGETAEESLHVDVMNLTPAEVLHKLCEDYPLLVNSLYEAFFSAIKGGYGHNHFSIHQIMKAKLN